MMSAIGFILGFIVILAVLILVHEAGHFIVAKLANVKVLEFGMGFPPRLLSLQKGETVYSVNAIPLGGFVKMVGEEDPSGPRSLAGKSVLVRFLVITAGPFMNVVMALLLFTVLFMIPQDVAVGDVTIAEVLPDSPAEEAGLSPGDVVIEANGEPVDNHLALSLQINLSRGQRMTWLIERGGRQFQVGLMPRLNPPEGEGATGIRVSTSNAQIESRTRAPWTAAGDGFQAMGGVIVLTKNEFSKWIAGGRAPQVAGPIGMAQVFGEVAQEPEFRMKERVMLALNLAAVISLSLAIFNILPIPALDGGRLPFLLIEWVGRGRRVPPRLEGLVHVLGFALLITLAIIISAIDVFRLSNGESLLGG